MKHKEGEEFGLCGGVGVFYQEMSNVHRWTYTHFCLRSGIMESDFLCSVLCAFL